MVLMAEPLVQAVEAARAMAGAPARTILLSPQGRRFDQALARELAAWPGGLVLVCGRYEGIDERAVEVLAPEEVSIGDFVLSGGEAAALVVLDAVARLVPGVLPGALEIKLRIRALAAYASVIKILRSPDVPFQNQKGAGCVDFIGQGFNSSTWLQSNRRGRALSALVQDFVLPL